MTHVEHDQEVCDPKVRNQSFGQLTVLDPTHSAPACPPNPTPPRPIALGGDHAKVSISPHVGTPRYHTFTLTAIVQSGNDDPGSCSGGEHKASFDHCEDGKSSRSLKHRSRDDLDAGSA